MKVLQIIPRLHSGGAEVGSIDIARYLIQQGHQAYIATHSGDMITKCHHENITVFQHPVHSKNPIDIYRNSLWLKKVIALHEIDIVHVRSRAPAWSVHWALTHSNTPWVTTYHGAYSQNSWLKKQYNAIMTKGQATIAPSKFISHHLQKHFPENQHKVVTIPRGSNPDQFQPSLRPSCKHRKQLNLEPIDRVIMMPARITRLKGHTVAIQALATIKPLLESHKVKVRFVGNTSNRDYVKQLQQQIKQKNLEHTIEIHDHVGNPEHLYALADLVMICSTQPESFGRTAIEAQMMGKIVIGSNHGGCQETIQHNKTGWLTEPGDPLSLSEAIEKAISLPNHKRLAMSQAAQKWVKQFSLSHFCQTTTDLYQKIISERAYCPSSEHSN